MNNVPINIGCSVFWRWDLDDFSPPRGSLLSEPPLGSIGLHICLYINMCEEHFFLNTCQNACCFVLEG
jgi:hypothetical protein